MPDVSLVVLTYNNIDYTRRLVDSVIANAGDVSYEFIFVDSGSTDGSLEYFQTLENARALQVLERPFVFNRNLNVGVEAADAEIVICANNDIEVRSEDFFTPIIRTLHDNPALGVLGVELGEPRDELIQLVLINGYTIGCFFALRRAVWEQLGGFNETYTGYGCEEADLAVRLLRAGYRAGYLRGVFCYHAGGATFSHGYATPEACFKNAQTFQQLHGYALNFDEKADFWDNLQGYIDSVFTQEWNKKVTKLDIGCGGTKPAGYIGIDCFIDSRVVDLVWDLNNGIPYPDSSVDEVRADNVLEHLPDPIRSMNEIYRVLKPGGLLHAIVPSTDGRGAWQDPSHRSFWNDNSWGYYSEGAGIDPGYQSRLGITCHFRIQHVETIVLYGVPYTNAKLRAAK